MAILILKDGQTSRPQMRQLKTTLLTVLIATSRLAVVSKYEGENEDLYGKYQFWGIITDPSQEPSWSAKSGGWVGQDLEKPTAEEVAFLKNMQVEIGSNESDNRLGNNNLALSESSEKNDDGNE